MKNRLTSTHCAAAAATAAAAAALSFSALPAHAETIFGMTTVNSQSTSPGLALVRFDSATPGTVTTIGSFAGVVAGQALRSIDFRPATGELYAISTSTTTANFAQAQLYTVNLATAALTPVGAGLTLTGNTNVRVEMDFNPVVDRIRIVTGGATANNFRANPITGALVQPDTDLAYAPGDALVGNPPALVAAAYSNNTAGATSTTLYGYDYGFDNLVTVGGVGGTPSPNAGQLFTVGTPPAGFLTTNAAIGMDISGATGILYMTHDDPVSITPMSLYKVNTATGVQTLVGAYGGGLFIADISVQIAAVPEPATYLTTALGLAGLMAWKRRFRG